LQCQIIFTPYPNNSLTENEVVLPPIYRATETKVAANPRFFREADRRQGDLRINFASLVSDFPELIELQLALCKLTREINSGKKQAPKTLEKFIEEFKKDSLIPNATIEKFANEIIYNIVAAPWGVEIFEAKQYMAHYGLNYLSLGMNWFDAPHGLSSYIHAMKDQFTNCDVRTNTPIKNIELVPGCALDTPKYNARLMDGTLLLDALSNPMQYD